jgi:glutathione S-transferase
MPNKLYVVPGSHPCAATAAALDLKGVAYKRVDWLPVVHKLLARATYGAPTVPGMKLEGEKVVGSRAIMRRLDALVAEPPLYPADPERRAQVERAEEWGDEVWQPIARRLLWGTLRRCPEALVSYSEGSRIPLPAAAIRAGARLIVRGEVALNRAADGAVRADLRNLPRHLDRIDRWIAEGVLAGGPGAQPNAGDLQIATTSRLLMTIGDVAPFFAGRAAERHARDLFGDQPGSTPRGVLPADWLAGSPPRQP